MKNRSFIFLPLSLFFVGTSCSHYTHLSPPDQILTEQQLEKNWQKGALYVEKGENQNKKGHALIKKGQALVKKGEKMIAKGDRVKHQGEQLKENSTQVFYQKVEKD